MKDLMEDIETEDEEEESGNIGSNGNGDDENVHDEERNEGSWEPEVHPDEDTRSRPIGLMLGANSGVDCLGVGDMMKKEVDNHEMRDELRCIAEKCEKIQQKKSNVEY